MIRMILNMVLSVVAYAVSLYFLEFYGFLYGIDFSFKATNTIEIVKIYLLIGVVFWIGFSIVKSILDILTLPVQYMTLWVTGWLTSIAIMYICKFIINLYLTGITMDITSVAGVVILSVILSFLTSLIYRLLKKII